MLNPDGHDLHTIALTIAQDFALLEEVEAVLLGGSLATGQSNEYSDIDLYIYTTADIPIKTRAKLINPRASQMQLNNPFWEVEDYWIEQETSVKVEAIYRNLKWAEDYIKALFATRQVHMGYSTSLWHNIVTAEILFDRKGWAVSLQTQANVAYPDALANAIIRKNRALLKGSLANHPQQLKQAVARNDLVFIHNRINAMLECYFDILFALNRELHPGSKRQLADAQKLNLKPKYMQEDITGLLTNWTVETVGEQVDTIVTRLEQLLDREAT